MGITNLSLGNLTELVFENRNRQYGAYVLRKQYSDRLLIASISGITIILLLVVSPLIAEMFKSPPEFIPEKEYPKQITYVPPAPPIETKEENKPDKPALPKQPEQPAPKGFAGSPIAGNETDTTEVNLFNEELKPGDPNGPEITDPNPPIEPEGPRTMVVKKKDPERWADEMPAFNGDLRKWLGSNLSYPVYAKEAAIQGTVYVEFVVDEEGNVSDAKVLRDIGGGCGEAALKTVRSMPKWKPGIKKGEKVKVYFTLPIKFSLR